MKVIIAGSRNMLLYAEVEAAMCEAAEAGIIPTQIVSGCARGVDMLGEHWARKHNLPVRRFPADWDRYGKAAGVVRNQQMAQYADALVALPMGQSSGTRNMMNIARTRGLQIHIHEVSV